MLDTQSEAFREEAAELLGDLETALLDLEENPEDGEIIAQVFRAMHTIKGSGAMFGFDAVAAFTHEVETVFDLVRNGRIAVGKELVTLSLAARDHINTLLDSGDQPAADTLAAGERLTAAFRQLQPAVAEDAAQPVSQAPPAALDEAEAALDVTYRIRLRLPEDIVLRGTRPDALLEELSELGPCRTVAQTEPIPLLSELTAEHCYTFWDIILTTNQGLDAIRDVFIFIEDDIDLKIDIIDDGGQLESEQGYKRLGEILVERGDLSAADLAEVLATQKPLGELLVASKGVHPDKVTAALQEQEAVRQARQKRQTQEGASSIRVPADKLDFLVNMVGELVTVQARLSQVAANRNDTDLIEIAEEVERLTAELRDSSLEMRMLPIGTTFSKFKRLVRDLSQDLGKNVELVTDGGDTELDKTVIERLNDPLVHLIRNSIDHGIEMPQERLAAGKQESGTVRLAAEHSGDSVILEIQDDGKGLNREAILAKAVEKGLIAADAQLRDSEAFELIFAAGFSTAQSVTSVSGRGVGMDVVKRAIEALRGTITIASEAGKGSTIRIRIPLTLAIVESLLVKIGDDSYVLPLSAVEECVELTRQDVARSHGRHLATVRDQLIPYIPLRQQFAIAGEPPEIEQIVITRVYGQQVGFVVDRVIGEHQTVIKSLGPLYRDVQGLSGATILGDGTVALILDVPQLVQQVEQAEAEAV